MTLILLNLLLFAECRGRPNEAVTPENIKKIHKIVLNCEKKIFFLLGFPLLGLGHFSPCVKMPFFIYLLFIVLRYVAYLRVDTSQIYIFFYF